MLSVKHPTLRPAAGLYPTHLDLQKAEDMVAFIREHCERLVAIGEVGLDFWAVKEAPEREVQREIFKMFIDLSLEIDLPLNVHSRSAGRHAVSLLLERNAQPSDSDIDAAMSGNICRCGTYTRIRKAIRKVAEDQS